MRQDDPVKRIVPLDVIQTLDPNQSRMIEKSNTLLRVNQRPC